MASTIDGLLPQTTTTTSNINPFLMGKLTDVLNATTTEVNKPYQAYTGQRIAQFSDDELRAQELVRQQQGMYNPQFNNATGYINQGAGGLSNILNNPNFTQNQIQGYMNPYNDLVIKATIEELNRANAMEQNQIRSQAGMSGAYGGSRLGIREAESSSANQRNIGSQVANLLSSSYGSALDQLNKDRAAVGDAAKGLVSTGSTLGSTAAQAQTSAYKDINALSASGADQRTLAQNNLDTAYQDFLTQKDYNYNQLAKLNSMLSGVSLNNFSTGNTTTSAPVRSSPSALQNVLGGVTAGAGLLKSLFGDGGLFAKGGLVKGYAEGGKVSQDKKRKKRRNPAMAYGEEDVEVFPAMTPEQLAVMGYGVSGNPTPMNVADMSTLAMLLNNMGMPMQGTSGNPTPTMGTLPTPNQNILPTNIKAPEYQYPPIQVQAMNGEPVNTGWLEALGNTTLEDVLRQAQPISRTVDSINQGIYDFLSPTQLNPNVVAAGNSAATGASEPPQPKRKPQRSTAKAVLREASNEGSTPVASDITAQLNNAVMGNRRATPNEVIMWNQPPVANTTPVSEPNFIERLLGMGGGDTQVMMTPQRQNKSRGFEPNPLLMMGLEILASEPDPYNPMGQIAKASMSGLERYEEMRKGRSAEDMNQEQLEMQKQNQQYGREDTMYERQRNAQKDALEAKMAEAEIRRTDALIRKAQQVAESTGSTKFLMDQYKVLSNNLAKMDPASPMYQVYLDKYNMIGTQLGLGGSDSYLNAQLQGDLEF